MLFSVLVFVILILIILVIEDISKLIIRKEENSSSIY